MTACAAFRALRRVPRPASALAALVCSPTPLAHQGARPPASLGGWPGAAGSRAARRAAHARHCDALDELDGASASPGSPRRRQQERSGSPFSAADPRSASDRPLPARRPVQKKFPGVLPRQQIPAFPVTGPVAGSVPARAPQAIPAPLVAIGTAISQRTRSQRPRVTGCWLGPPGSTGQYRLHRSDRMPGSGRLQSRRRGFGSGARSADMECPGSHGPSQCVMVAVSGRRRHVLMRSGCVGFEPYRAEVVSCGQAHVGV